MIFVKVTLLSIWIVLIPFILNGQDTSYCEHQVLLLQETLKKYESININDWMYFPCDSCVRAGEKSQQVVLLRKDLLLTGDLTAIKDSAPNVLDKDLGTALKQFQQRNGLDTKGILDRPTIDALNVPLVLRIAQIKENIASWQSFKDSIAEPFVLVNIPGFILETIENGKATHTMKVIVGRTTKQTPILRGVIKSIIIHPSWVLPNSIIIKEIIPIMLHDSEYLNREHIEVYAYIKKDRTLINKDTIKWSTITKKNLNFELEQTPGTWNQLGKLKFIFDNQYSIYLHDTPQKYLFNHSIRAYSHGCIRVEKPVELAAWLLKKKSSQVSYLLNDTISETILLPKPVSIAVQYFTCWVDKNGLLQFRNDIYNRNEVIIKESD